MRELLLAVWLGGGAAWATPEPEPDGVAAPAAEAPALTPAAPADVEAGEALLRRLVQATMDADVAAYLACVTTTDAVFRMEERHWIEDVVTNRVMRFSLAAEEWSRAGDELRCTLTATWSMNEKDARELTFPARFVAGESGWLYAGRVWERLEGEHCVVLFTPERAEVAQTVMEVFPGVMDTVNIDMELGEAVAHHVQEIKIYDSMKELQYSIFPSYVDGLGGWNEPGEAIKILTGRRSGPEGLRSLLAHEYGHVGTFVMGEKATEAPWWMLEGVAELVAEPFSNSRERVQRRVLGWAKEGNLAKWEDMFHFPLPDKKWGGHVYTQGHHMMMFIHDTYGRTPRNQWVRLLSQGHSLEEASQQALGLSFEALDRDWRAALEQAVAEDEARKAAEEAAPATTSGT